MSAKERAIEIYNHHIALASTDGRLFRKTVMDQLMAELDISLASAATHYNTAKKLAAPVEGLGRAPAPKGLKRPGATKGKAEVLQDDDECFTVIELVTEGKDVLVGRCQSFLMQGDASEKFDEKVEAWPFNTWVLIQGLGPISGETFKLEQGEQEIKRYTPEVKAEAGEVAA